VLDPFAVHPDIRPGSVWWIDFGMRSGREQHGRRPAVVVSSADALQILQQLVAVLPCTTVPRGWPNHVRLDGELRLPRITYAMTEQVITIDREALIRPLGLIDDRCQAEIRRWLHDWLI